MVGVSEVAEDTADVVHVFWGSGVVSGWERWVRGEGVRGEVGVQGMWCR